MEIAKLVLEYLQALLWPGITVTALLIFRKQLRQLLTNIGTAVHRVKKFTAPGTAVELIEGLTQSTDEVIPTEPAKKRGLGTGTGSWVTDSEGESLDDLTTGKIIRIWTEIESSLDELRRRHFGDWGGAPGTDDQKLRERRYTSPTQAIRSLTTAGVIPPGVGRNLDEARQIRNQVVHGKETIPLGAVDDYLRTISKLRDYLKQTVEMS